MIRINGMTLRITGHLAVGALAVLVLAAAVLMTGVRDGWGTSVNLLCCAVFAIWTGRLADDVRRSISRPGRRNND